VPTTHNVVVEAFPLQIQRYTDSRETAIQRDIRHAPSRNVVTHPAPMMATVAGGSCMLEVVIVRFRHCVS
jgi:hypothetical protein